MLQLKQWMLVMCIGKFLRSFPGLPQSLDFLRPGPLAAMPTKQTQLQQHHMDVSRHFAGSNRSLAGWCSKSVLVGFLIPEYSRMFEVTKNHQKSMIKRYYRCWKSMAIIKNPWLIEFAMFYMLCWLGTMFSISVLKVGQGFDHFGLLSTGFYLAEAFVGVQRSRHRFIV